MADESRELIIVGGGPAGLAAAVEARRTGVDVLVIEERATLGGQVYKQFPTDFAILDPKSLGADYLAGRRLIEEAQGCGAEIRLNSVVWGIWNQEVATYGDDQGARVISAKRILLAPGAYDRPVVLPGWTLPGVMTAGGVQGLVKIQRVLPGRRVLMAGSGPLILAFAAQIHRHGVNVVAVVEAAPFPGFGLMTKLLHAARGNMGLLREGLQHMAYLRRHRVPYLYSHLLARIDGSHEVASATVSRVDRDWRPVEGTERTFDVDTVCLGYGFFPSTELSRLCGCEHVYVEDLGGWVPVRDPFMRTTVPGILAAGDGSGVAGSAVALEEGRTAGITAALDTGRISQGQAEEMWQRPRQRLLQLQRFRHALNSIYKVGAGIYELAEPDTVVCRCESVSMKEILDSTVVEGPDCSIVKCLTRAGMGRCQGRYCSRQIAALLAHGAGVAIDSIPSFTPRPPVKPVPIMEIADNITEDELIAE